MELIYLPDGLLRQLIHDKPIEVRYGQEQAEMGKIELMPLFKGQCSLKIVEIAKPLELTQKMAETLAWNGRFFMINLESRSIRAHDN